MRRFGWGRASACAVVALIVGLLPVATGTSPAAATHSGSFLQVTPEVSTVDVGTDVTLTARLFLHPSVTRTPVPAAAGPVDVHFTFLGGPLGAGTRSCTVPQLESTCSITVVSPTSGSSDIRARIDDGPEDTGEGRLATGSEVPTDQPPADCIGPDEGDTDVATCQAGDSVAPGAAEPDDTDVVRVTWLDRGLDVQPEVQTRALGETATLTATAYDMAGNPAPNTVVKWELYEGSVSDPGGATTLNLPDRTCTTGADGACAITLTQAANGVDGLCAWTAAAAPPASGKATDNNVTCDGEGLLDPTANDGKPSPVNDDQDVVRITWGTGGFTTPGTGASADQSGYWLVAADGGIFAFGTAAFHGSTGAIRLNKPVVGMAATPSRGGYWLVASDGGIFSFGDAVFRGSTGATKLNQPIVGMAATPGGNGYWLVASDGGIFAFGGALFRGSTGATRLAQPIVGMASTPSGNGYWLVAADGGVFSFGDAVFRGSTGATRLAQPIVGMASTPSGRGYWLVAADGGVFAFGDAAFHGSTGAIKLAQPMVGMSRSTSGGGYRLLARDGGVFAFGDATFRGSTGAIRLNQPMVGMSGF